MAVAVGMAGTPVGSVPGDGGDGLDIPAIAVECTIAVAELVTEAISDGRSTGSPVAKLSRATRLGATAGARAGVPLESSRLYGLISQAVIAPSSAAIQMTIAIAIQGNLRIDLLYIMVWTANLPPHIHSTQWLHHTKDLIRP